MSKPRKISDEAMEEFKAEAMRRARGKSNKVVATLRRMYEQSQEIDVSCGTKASQP